MRKGMLLSLMVCVMAGVGCTYYDSDGRLGIGGRCPCEPSAPVPVGSVTVSVSRGSTAVFVDAGVNEIASLGDAGQSLDSGFANDGGDLVECTINQECGDDEDCVANTCLERCDSSCDCHSGLTCQTGYCRAPLTLVPIDAGVSEDGGLTGQCAVNQDCASDYDCVNSLCLQRCVGVCECDGGLACVDGYCQ